MESRILACPIRVRSSRRVVSIRTWRPRDVRNQARQADLKKYDADQDG